MNKLELLVASLAAFSTFPGYTLGADQNWVGLGTPGAWSDAANWNAAVPSSGDNVFIHTTSTSITGSAFSAGTAVLSVGVPGNSSSGFTFGAGTTNIGTLLVGEGHTGTSPLNNQFGRVFINAGTTLTTGNFFLGDWDGGTGQAVQNGGAVTVNGQLRMGHWGQADVGAGTASIYTLNGGTLDVNGAAGNPYLDNGGPSGQIFLGIDSTGVLNVNGGTLTAQGITLDNRSNTGGEDKLEVTGGTLNLGVNGILSPNAADATTYAVRLGGGTLRATASWSSNVQTTLTSGGTGIHYDTNGNNITLTGNVVGAGGLTKDGAGTLFLHAAGNTFSGGMNITAGTVQVGDGATLNGSLAGDVTNNGSLVFANPTALTYGGSITGGGSVKKSAAGQLTLLGASSYGGGTTIDAGGSVRLGNEAVNGSITGSVTNNGNLTFSPATEQTFSGDISGMGSVTKTGGSKITLLGNDTYSGGFNVAGGTLQIGNGTTVGNLGTGNSTVNGLLVITKTNATTIDGDINAGGPSGTMLLLSGGAVTLASGTDVKLTNLQFGQNGANETIGGTMNIGAGTSLTISGELTMGNSGGGGSTTSGIINQTGGQVDINVPGTDGRQFVLGHWGSTQGTYTLSGGVLNAPNISMAVSWDGEGTFNMSGGAANLKGLRFGHNGGRTGVVNFTGGTLTLGTEGLWSQNDGLPTDINLGGGTIKLGASNGISVATELTGTNGNTVFDTNGNNLAVSKIMSGAGGFSKINAGTMTLTAQNTYRGSTIISGGTLDLSNGQIYSDYGWGNVLTRVENGATIITGGWADGDTLNAKIGLGQVNFSASNLVVDNGTLRYTGISTTGNSDRTFTIGALGATLDAQSPNGTTWNIADLGRNYQIASNGGTLTLTGTTKGVIGQIIPGTGGVNKTGGNTWVLTGNNTYTGPTNISAGTLEINGATAGGAVTTTSGAILAGIGTIGGNVISTGGVISPGTNGGADVGSLFVTGSVSLDSSSVLQITINDSTIGSLDRLVTTAGFTAGSATLSVTFNDTTFVIATSAADLAAATRYQFIAGPASPSSMFGNATPLSGADLAALGLSGSPNPQYGITVGSQRFWLENGSWALVPISPVPEPSVMAGILGALLMGNKRRRRR